MKINNLIQSVQEHLEEEGLKSLVLHWIVCPQCRGNGSSTLYLGDVTEMIHEDPDFAEDYWRGHYDRECDTCYGRTTVPEVDENRTDAESLKVWHEWVQDYYETEAIYAMERRMGA
jgi:hypothetical protein